MSQPPEGPRSASLLFSQEQPRKPVAVSNLTKNLMLSDSQSYQQLPEPNRNTQARPINVSGSVSSSNKFIPAGSANSLSHSFGRLASSLLPHHALLPFPSTLVYQLGQFTPSSVNHMPFGHNTPSMVSSSYTPNYSYTPSYSDSQQNPSVQAGFFPGFYKNFSAPLAPTTTVSMHSANSNSNSTVNFPASTPANAQLFDQLLSPKEPKHSADTPGLSLKFQFAQPDHYMSYDEYLDSLNKRDSLPDKDGYEEHLNIVKYPVNDLITMLACLLTKIIEANDKLHPNHFDNTIAIRQKMREDRRQKKLEKSRRSLHARSTFFDNEGVNTTVEHVDEDLNSSDDEEDKDDDLKNRYLANVLAFHGTNIPGISLNAYLTRVLKYCPITNEVFLSLLVYFDRIARRANNLNKNKQNGEGDDSEQLFVMDSYNIHRLIILGITVSSKFFSDIFYKNLRYAKVGGLPLEELNYLELQFLLLLDFKLMISVEDLQNYGDLLLKFWKREQLAEDGSE